MRHIAIRVYDSASWMGEENPYSISIFHSDVDFNTYHRKKMPANLEKLLENCTATITFNHKSIFIHYHLEEAK